MCKQTQQLQTLMDQQCWELLCPFGHSLSLVVLVWHITNYATDLSFKESIKLPENRQSYNYGANQLTIISLINSNNLVWNSQFANPLSSKGDQQQFPPTVC